MTETDAWVRITRALPSHWRPRHQRSRRADWTVGLFMAREYVRCTVRGQGQARITAFVRSEVIRDKGEICVFSCWEAVVIGMF